MQFLSVIWSTQVHHYEKTSQSVFGGSLQDFDPRSPDGCQIDQQQLGKLLQAVKRSLPTRGLLHCWDVSHNGHQTSAAGSGEVASAIIPWYGKKGQVTIDGGAFIDTQDLSSAEYASEQIIAKELSVRIEQMTIQEAKSTLWCDLHVAG